MHLTHKNNRSNLKVKQINHTHVDFSNKFIYFVVLSLNCWIETHSHSFIHLVAHSQIFWRLNHRLKIDLQSIKNYISRVNNNLSDFSSWLLLNRCTMHIEMMREIKIKKRIKDWMFNTLQHTINVKKIIIINRVNYNTRSTVKSQPQYCCCCLFKIVCFAYFNPFAFFAISVSVRARATVCVYCIHAVVC